MLYVELANFEQNEAAHDINVTTSKSDAKDVLDFTKAILEYLFVFAAAFESFKKRRERNENQEPNDQGGEYG